MTDKEKQPEEEKKPSQRKERKRKPRGKGEGSIFYRKDRDEWVAQITLEDGKTKQVYRKKREDAAEALNKMLYEQQHGTFVMGPKQTVKQFLEYWLEDVHKPQIRLGTYNGHRIIIHKHLIPAIGHLQLQKLTTQHIQSLYARKQKEGMTSGGVRTIHAVLHNALKYAVRVNSISQNVCDKVEIPRIQQHEMQSLNSEQARKLLEVIKGHSLEGLLTVALATGMRKGELLALRWRDVNFEDSYLQVRRTLSYISGNGFNENEPKTSKGRRRIVLPPFVIEALKQHRTRQKEIRLKAGSLWVDNDLVFCNKQGGYLFSEVVSKQFTKLLQQANLPAIRFHDLRHSAATILLSMGIHPKMVQELLGHSSISITLDTYSHVLPTMQEELAQKLDQLYGQ